MRRRIYTFRVLAPTFTAGFTRTTGDWELTAEGRTQCDQIAPIIERFTKHKSLLEIAKACKARGWKLEIVGADFEVSPDCGDGTAPAPRDRVPERHRQHPTV